MEEADPDGAGPVLDERRRDRMRRQSVRPGERAHPARAAIEQRQAVLVARADRPDPHVPARIREDAEDVVAGKPVARREHRPGPGAREVVDPRSAREAAEALPRRDPPLPVAVLDRDLPAAPAEVRDRRPASAARSENRRPSKRASPSPVSVPCTMQSSPRRVSRSAEACGAPSASVYVVNPLRATFIAPEPNVPTQRFPSRSSASAPTVRALSPCASV